MKRAGVKAWPKLFQNLRSTRETELAESYPLHVATAWVGNSQIVALKHYLQITEDHFARASASSEATQNPTQHTSELTGTTVNDEKAGPAESVSNPLPDKTLRPNAGECSETDRGVREGEMGGKGLEPLTLSV